MLEEAEFKNTGADTEEAEVKHTGAGAGADSHTECTAYTSGYVTDTLKQCTIHVTYMQLTTNMQVIQYQTGQAWYRHRIQFIHPTFKMVTWMVQLRTNSPVCGQSSPVKDGLNLSVVGSIGVCTRGMDIMAGTCRGTVF